MLEDEVLDLARGDRLALADDHVLEPARDGDEAVSVHMTEVAGPEPALLVERVGVERVVDVAAEDLWALHAQLALLAGSDLATVEVDDARGHAPREAALG